VNARDSYQPVVDAFLGGLEVGIYASFALVAVWMAVSAVRRIVGAA